MSDSSTTCLLRPYESVRLCFKRATPDTWTLGEPVAITVTLENEEGVRICEPRSRHLWTHPQAPCARQGLETGVSLQMTLDGHGADEFRLGEAASGTSVEIPNLDEIVVQERRRQGDGLVLDLTTGIAEGSVTVLQSEDQKSSNYHQQPATHNGENKLTTTTGGTEFPPESTVAQELDEMRGTPGRVAETEGRGGGGGRGRGKEKDERQDVFLSLVVQLPVEWAARFNRPVLSLRSLPARVIVCDHTKEYPSLAAAAAAGTAADLLWRRPGLLQGPCNVRRLRFAICASSFPTTNTKADTAVVSPATTIASCTERPRIAAKTFPLGVPLPPPRTPVPSLISCPLATSITPNPTTVMELTVAESRSLGGYFGTIWDCSLALASFLIAGNPLDQSAATVRGKRVVELGAGCGVVSAVCAALGAAEVVATDAQDLLPLLRLNVERWRSDLGLQNFKVEKYDWGTLPSESVGEAFDVIVCSDLVYDPTEWPALRQSLSLLGGDNSVVYLAHRKRNEQEKDFFDILGSSRASGDAGRGYGYRRLFPSADARTKRHGSGSAGILAGDQELAGFDAEIEGVWREGCFPDVVLYELLPAT